MKETEDPAIACLAPYFKNGIFDIIVKCGVSLAWQTLITLGYDIEAAAGDSAESDDLWERKQAIYPYALACALQQYLDIGLPGKEDLEEIVFNNPHKFNPQYVEWQLQDKVILAVLDTASVLNSPIDHAIDLQFRGKAGLLKWAEFLENDPKLLKKERLDKPFDPAGEDIAKIIRFADN
jgi:hypothetical protein